MEPIPAEELKAEKFPRISAEDLIQLCELSGPSKAPNPAKSSKSSKPLIVVIDVRSEDEYPLCSCLPRVSDSWRHFVFGHACFFVSQ